MIQNYINHIAFAIDRSGSMGGLENEVVKVFDNQIKHLAMRSKELNQETRVTVFLFDDIVENLIYDMDVIRLPSLAQHYKVRNSTALIDATLRMIDDLRQTPELYGDHSWLCLVLSDGGENASSNKPEKLKQTLNNLPDNWTVGVMVPNQHGIHEAKKFGFSSNNISVWSADKAGINEVGNTITKATDNYMRARATGVRSTKNLFDLDASNLDAKTVQTNLDELKNSEYQIFPVHGNVVIKDYIESWTKKDYRVGSVYYQISKPEKIQGYKQVCVQSKRNGKVYAGTNARKMLKLPDTEVKVSPGDFGDWNLFIQSTSTNRKLIDGTQVLVMQ